MLRRTLLQALAFVPFLRSLVAGGTPVAWHFEAMVGLYPMVTTPIRSKTSERYAYKQGSAHWVSVGRHDVRTLDVRVEAAYECLRQFSDAFWLACTDAPYVPHALYATCEIVVHGTSCGVLTIRNITAHKEAFIAACNHCAVPMQAIEGVIASFTLVERRKVT